MMMMMMMLMMVMMICVNGDSASSHYFNVLDFGAKRITRAITRQRSAMHSKRFNGGVVFAPLDCMCSMDILRFLQELR